MTAPDPGSATRTVRLVLVADPGLAAEIARELASDLPDRLRRQLGSQTEWQVRTVTAPLVADEQVEVSDMAEVVSTLLPDDDWDLAVCLTDLPRRAHLSPVSVEVSPDRRVALVSLPALGALGLHRRVARAVVGVVGRLAPDIEGPALPAVLGRRATGAERAAEDSGPCRGDPNRYVVPGLRGHLRLVSGMVRANRPWRLFTTLSKSLAGVFATAAFGMINTSTWLIAVGLSSWRQVLIAVLSVGALTAWIIIDHELWERAGGDLPSARARLYLYNLVTAVCISLGVLFLYAVLFVALTAVAALLLVPSVFGQILQQPAQAHDYVALSWFITSIAMVGGAFGSGLEEDEAVRNAAYGQRHRDRWKRLREQGVAQRLTQ
ncbi:hypothetical protein [Streptomyces sp. NPDC051219]|uniref:hypothetical protein n=1 Tax=Streptomyces sp. NPDC051219 TaxID=3155283 RepID=UPI003413FA31